MDCNKQNPSEKNGQAQVIYRFTHFLKSILQIKIIEGQPLFLQSNQLIALSNPFNSIYDQFVSLTIPSTKLITRQIVQIMRKSIEAYRQKKMLHDLKNDFLPRRLSDPQRQELELQLQKLMELTQNNLKLVGLSEYPSLVQSSIIGLGEQQREQFASSIQQNLARYKIVPRKIRLDKIQKVIAKLKLYFQLQLLIDEQNQRVSVDIQHTDKGSFTKILTLEQVLADRRQIQCQEGSLEQSVCTLFNRIMRYTQCVNSLFGTKPETHWIANPKNILVYVEETQQGWKLAEEAFELDLMSVILKQLQFDQQIKSFEQKIVSHELVLTPLPPINSFDFHWFVNKLQNTSTIPLKEREIQAILSWLLVADTLFSRFLTPEKQTVFQTIIDSETVIKKLLEKDRQTLNLHTIEMLTLYDMTYASPNSAPQQIFQTFSFSRWNQILKENPTQDEFFESKRYLDVQLPLFYVESLFFDQDNLKNMLQRHRFLMPLENIGRYLVMYMLAKHALIQIQTLYQDSEKQRAKNIHENARTIKPYSGQGLSNKKYGVAQTIERLMVVIKKIEQKIDGDYRLRHERDPNKRYLLEHKDMLKLFYELHYYHEPTTKAQQKFEELNSEEQEEYLNGFSRSDQEDSFDAKQELIKAAEHREIQINHGQYFDLIEKPKEKRVLKRRVVVHSEGVVGRYGKDNEISYGKPGKDIKFGLKRKKAVGLKTEDYLSYKKLQTLMEMVFSANIDRYSELHQLSARLRDRMSDLKNEDLNTIMDEMNALQGKLVGHNFTHILQMRGVF